jgi:hypothetical protein
MKQKAMSGYLDMAHGDRKKPLSRLKIWLFSKKGLIDL